MKLQGGAQLKDAAPGLIALLSTRFWRRGFLKNWPVSAELGGTDRQNPSGVSGLRWVDFWKKWAPVWAFLSVVLFERLSVFPADIRPALVRCLLPIGPIWALLLWRSRPMRPGVFFANFVAAGVWWLVIDLALLVWFDPEVRQFNLQVGLGPESGAENLWIATHAEAWDSIQVAHREGLHHVFERIVVSNRSDQDSKERIVITFTLGESVRILRAAVRLSPYSSVAPSQQEWIWRQIPAPAESAGIPGGFCSTDLSSREDWTWCKIIEPAPDHTVQLQIRRLERRQAAVIYAYAEFAPDISELASVQVLDLPQVRLQLKN